VWVVGCGRGSEVKSEAAAEPRTSSLSSSALFDVTVEAGEGNLQVVVDEPGDVDPSSLVDPHASNSSSLTTARVCATPPENISGLQCEWESTPGVAATEEDDDPKLEADAAF
jgi:hypothetical protein